MAGTIQTFKGVFDNVVRDQLSTAAVLAIATNGANKKNRETDANKRKRIVTAQNQIAWQPDFTILARTTAAETFAVAELMTARGVLFPAGSLRLLEIEFYVAGDASDETGWARHTALVSGGTTPIVRVVTVPASTPVQVGGNTLSGVAGAGFTATPAVTVVAGAGTVTVNVVSAEAEILNWCVEIRVGKLRPMLLGV